MLDTHCHLDLYSEPSQTAADAEQAGVFTIFVTNLPSAFDAAFPHTRQFKKVRIALGLHPLTAESHNNQELDRFKKLAWTTSFIGEVGLDFSRDGLATRDKQLNSFRFVLRSLENRAKFVTIHSRQAESAVLDLLDEHYKHPVVFHWYSGTQRNMDSALDRGHFFSVNPSMLRGMKGQKLVARIPKERVLTESDGPFINVGQRQVVPSDVQLVERGLAEIWGIEPPAVRSIVAENFQVLLKPVKQAQCVRPLT